MSQSPPHDHAYQGIFSHPQMVQDLLHGFVHEAWVAELDFASLERVNARHLSDRLHAREGDLIWRLKLRREWLYVYLLLEFQSRDDRWMALRVLVYVGLLYQGLIRGRQLDRGERLPAVFPIVIYNGRKPRRAARDMVELVEPLPAGLQQYRPSQRYFLLDERRVMGEGPAGSDNLVRALIGLERTTDLSQLHALVSVLGRRLAAAEHESLRRALTAWLNQVVVRRVAPSDNPPQFRDLHEVNTMLEETVDGWVRKWKREGRREGLQEGRQEGMREGLHEGRIELLERLLTRRFGEPLPAWVRPRLQAASIERLDAWALAIFDARSLEDLLGPA